MSRTREAVISRPRECEALRESGFYPGAAFLFLKGINMTFIGWIAWNVKTQKPGSGAYYSSGAKVYKSEAIAKAAVKGRIKWAGEEFTFHKAYAEVEAPPEK